MSQPFSRLLQHSREQNQPLIAVHRGTAVGIIQPNTVESARAALASGGDIAELDVVRSRDGEYYTFHDGYERHLLNETVNLPEEDSATIDALWYEEYSGYNLGPIQKFRDVIAELPETFINVDRSYRYWKDGFLLEMSEWGDPDYLIIKSRCVDEHLDAAVECGVPYPFFGVVKSEIEVEKVLGSEKINLVGFEILASTKESPLLDKQFIQSLKERGLAIWINAINLENGKPLCAGFDDRTALSGDPDEGWGRLCDLGADIIQSDWPWLLRRYLNERNATIET